MKSPKRFDVGRGFPNSATPVGSSAYYGVCFAPSALRDDLALLFAWRGEMRNVLAACSDPGVARLKLQWWREELVRCSEGHAQHPLTQALTPVLKNRQLPPAPFLSMADATEAAVMTQPPKDLRDLEIRCDQDQGSLFELIGRCHGMTEPNTGQHLRRLGAFCGLICLIRDFGADLRRGYNPLPETLTAGEDPTDRALIDVQRKHLQRLALHTREFFAAIHPAYAVKQAKRASQSSVPSTSGSPPSVPPTISVRTAILSALLDEIERENFSVFDQRVCLTPLRKLWIGWRASRRGLFR
jgi:phytoene synthase